MTGSTDIQNLATRLSAGAFFSFIHTSVAVTFLCHSEYLYEIGKFHSWPLAAYLLCGVLINWFIHSKRLKPLKIKREILTVRRLFKYATVLFVSVIIFYVIAVLFGAPFFSSQEETLTFSILLTILVVLPLLLNLGLDSSISILLSANLFEKDALNTIFSTSVRFVLFGAWLGAVVIPLDWDRPWQVWPIPCSLGALIGSATSQVFILGLNLTKLSQTFNQVVAKKYRKYEL